MLLLELHMPQPLGLKMDYEMVQSLIDSRPCQSSRQSQYTAKNEHGIFHQN